MSGVTVQEFHGPDAFESVRADWEELHAASAEASPFLSWVWLAAWKNQFARAAAVRVLVARDGRAAIGAFALVDERVRIGGIPTPARRLTFLGARHAGPDYLDVVARAGRERDAAAAVFDHLAKTGGFDVCDLDGIATDSVSVQVLARRFGEDAGYTCEISPLFVCPRIQLASSWPDLLARSKRKDNFRRRLRQLRSHADFARREIRSPADVPAALERFLTLHERRWSARGGSDGLGRPSERAFHREAVVSLSAAGGVLFEELWVDGACRASIYGLNSDRTYAFYQSGFDPDWSGFSVGLVALGLSIEAAIDRGMLVYDFLHGVERYKFDWTSSTRETSAVRLVRPGPLARVLLAREQAGATARRTAHTLLPARAVEGIRRRRRAWERRG